MPTLPNGYEIYKPKPCFASTKDGGIMRLFNGTWEKAKIYRTGSRCYVCTTYRGVQTSQNATRLIAETYVPKTDGKDYAVHIDGDSTNLRADNIMWVSRSEVIERIQHYVCSRCKKSILNPLYLKSGEVICRRCRDQLKRSEKNQIEYDRKAKLCQDAIAHPGPNRADDMKRLREQGVSICTIGDFYGLSRERVRQITIKAGYKKPVTYGKSRG